MGNLITESTRWRWIFYINLPVGLLAVIALLIFLPANLSLHTTTWNGWKSLRHIDFLGALLCASATILLMLGLTWGGEHSSAWTSMPGLSILGGSIVLFVLFVFAERKAHEPILPLDLFRNPVFSVSAALALLQSMVLLGLALYLPLFFQGVLPLSPTNTGLVMTPFSLSMVVGAIVSTQVIGKFKRYRGVSIGAALLMSIGVLLITLMTPTTGILLVIVFLVLTGIGIGPFFSVPMLMVQNALPENYRGVSTAAVRYLGQMGATLGIAIVGTVVSSTTSDGLMSHLPTNAAGKQILAGALQHGFLAILIFALIALVVTFFMKEIPVLMAQGDSEQKEAAQVNKEADKELLHA